MRALAFGHLVPARPEDCGSLAHHPKQQGALFSSLEHPRRRHPRLSEPTEGRPEGEAEKVGGTQEGGQRRWRTAASRRPKRAHEGLLSGQNARLRGGVKIPRPHRERDRMAPVSRSTAPGNSHCTPTPSDAETQIESFVPHGDQIAARAEADFNGDGLPDVVLVVELASDRFKKYRPLLVLSRRAEGGYDDRGRGSR